MKSAICRKGGKAKPNYVVLTVGLWHMLHVTSPESFNQDLGQLKVAADGLIDTGNRAEVSGQYISHATFRCYFLSKAKAAIILLASLCTDCSHAYSLPEVKLSHAFEGLSRAAHLTMSQEVHEVGIFFTGSR